MQLALETAASRQVILVAKGAPTWIATPGGHLYVNGSGNAGLATAGSGDVLTGILAGLLAQRLSPVDAAVLGVYLHGLTAECIARERSVRGIVAGDLADALGLAYRELESASSMPS
jgi:NAD(P)H-hydrate epimerase